MINFKNKLISLLVLIFIATTIMLSSCESYQTVELTVKDSETGLALDSVYVEVKAGKNGNYDMSGTSGYTDSTGFFSGNFMIGCAFGCYDIYVECSKPGYKKYVSEVNVIEENILLQQE
jgi:hypothetical protein